MEVRLKIFDNSKFFFRAILSAYRIRITRGPNFFKRIARDLKVQVQGGMTITPFFWGYITPAF